MKKLLATSFLVECDIKRALLEARGIECFIKNEFSGISAGAGYLGPLGFALPELWVCHDEDYETACGYLREMERDAEAALEAEFADEPDENPTA